jgi:hypothetical protein
MTARISVSRFNHLLAQTTPVAAYLGVRAERIEDGEACRRSAQRSSRASRLEVSQRLPPIFSTSA